MYDNLKYYIYIVTLSNNQINMQYRTTLRLIIFRIYLYRIKYNIKKL